MYPNGPTTTHEWSDDEDLLSRVQRGQGTRWDDRIGAPTDLLHDDAMGYDARGKVTSVEAIRESVLNRYTGLGAIRRTETEAFSVAGSPETKIDEYSPDAFGNQEVVEYRGSRRSRYHYQHGTGRLLSTLESSATGTAEAHRYDAAGNQDQTDRLTWVSAAGGLAPVRRLSRYYYDATDRLRVADVKSDANLNLLGWSHAGAYEEYRYDALGRRVLVRTRRDETCPGCVSSIQRSVWDGEQVLAEIRMPGHDVLDSSPAGRTVLEADTATVLSMGCSDDRPHWCQMDNDPETGQDIGQADTIYSPHFGRVLYVHGPGIDRPLYVVRIGYGRDRVLFPAFALAPHANWRGLYDLGTVLGAPDAQHCAAHIRQSELTNDPDQETPSKQTRCLEVDWSASDRTAFLGKFTDTPERSWMGGLIQEQQDGSGLMYRRNRYYDPVQGRFTQEDPIGLAGGLNLYGFAAGDPVGYSDPFGLCPICDVADVGFFVHSAGKALFTPSRENLRNVALDGVGLLPFIPSAGMVRRIDDLVDAAKLTSLRSEFDRVVKPAFWKNQATQNAANFSAANLARMQKGRAPIGADGFPMELHHRTPLAHGGTNDWSNLEAMTRTDHRLGPNFKRNHPDP